MKYYIKYLSVEGYCSAVVAMLYTFMFFFFFYLLVRLLEKQGTIYNRKLGNMTIITL